MKGSGIITFASLRVEDLPLLCEWLNQPHMRCHYQKAPVSLAEVREKFMPRIQENSPVRVHLALHGGMPIGKVQCYRNFDHPDYASKVGLQEGISIDFFIGEVIFLYRGLGRRRLREYVTTVAFSIHPDDDKCFICHELNNLPARACSRAAGFQPLREVVEDGAASELMIFHKPTAYDDHSGT